jgi:chromosome segregation ATPase
MDLATLASLVAILLGASGLVTFGLSRRKAVLELGKKDGDIERLRKDLDHLYEKVRTLEARVSAADGDTREIKADIRHILEAIRRIETRIDARAPAARDGS